MELLGVESFLCIWLTLFACSYGFYLLWTKSALLSGFVNFWHTEVAHLRAIRTIPAAIQKTSSSHSSSGSGNVSGGLKDDFLLRIFTPDSAGDSVCRRNSYVSDDSNVEIIEAPSSHDIPERFLLKSYQNNMATAIKPAELNFANLGGDQVVPGRFQHSNTPLTTVSSAPLEVDQIEHWLADCLQFGEQNRHAVATEKRNSNAASSLLTCASSQPPFSHLNLRRSNSVPTAMNSSASLVATRRLSNSETCLQANTQRTSSHHVKWRDPLMGTNVDEFLSENIVTSQMDKLKGILEECCHLVESQVVSEINTADSQLPLGPRLSLETVKVTQLDLLEGLKNLTKMIDLRVRQTLSLEEKRSRLTALKTVVGAECSCESLVAEESLTDETPLRRTFSHCDCGCDQLVKMVEDLKLTFVQSQVSVQRDISAFTQQMQQLATELNALKTP